MIAGIVGFIYVKKPAMCFKNKTENRTYGERRRKLDSVDDDDVLFPLKNDTDN